LEPASEPGASLDDLPARGVSKDICACRRHTGSAAHRPSSGGPDGKVYPTWHPARDASGCAFGHEHGDDPRTSDLFSTASWPPFGYTSEVMLDNLAESSHRHEDHVGHKVLAVNNSNVIQGDNGSSLFPPQGTTIAVCDLLLKFHQGTHSPDAFSNNVHELLFNQRCTASNGGQVTEARYNAMIPLGRAGGFSPSECPGFGRPFINVKPAVPADSPSDTRSLGRLITEPGCVQAIREGRTHQDPLFPDPVPFTVSDTDDFWFSDISVTGAGLNFRVAPLFYVVNPSRYYDPSLPNSMGRIVELCYTNLAGGSNCDVVKRLDHGVHRRVRPQRRQHAVRRLDPPVLRGQRRHGAVRPGLDQGLQRHHRGRDPCT